jgi:hypothetical protein
VSAIRSNVPRRTNMTWLAEGVLLNVASEDALGFMNDLER